MKSWPSRAICLQSSLLVGSEQPQVEPDLISLVGQVTKSYPFLFDPKVAVIKSSSFILFYIIYLMEDLLSQSWHMTLVSRMYTVRDISKALSSRLNLSKAWVSCEDAH